MHKYTRRDVLRTTAICTFTTNLFTGNIKGANDKLAFAFIGLGNRGTGLLRQCLGEFGGNYAKEVEVVALCDVKLEHLERDGALVNKKTGLEPTMYMDFRELLARSGIDAVVISTPDHWHAYMTIEALKAGMHVYLEKPISRVLEESKKMRFAAEYFNHLVVQVGTQQRSQGIFNYANHIVKSGALGKIIMVDTWFYGSHPLPPKQSLEIPPRGLNWDLWLGPAPKINYDPTRGSPNFRSFWDYAGGILTDWGVHLLDIALWATNTDIHRVKTVALGSNYYLGKETPDILRANFELPDVLFTFKHLPYNPHMTEKDEIGREHGIEFIGDKGRLIIDRSGYATYSSNNKLELPEINGRKIPAKAKNKKVLHSPGHMENFINCIKSKQAPVSDIRNHWATDLCHLGNMAYRSGETVNSFMSGEYISPERAVDFSKMNYRAPWKIEGPFLKNHQ